MISFDAEAVRTRLPWSRLLAALEDALRADVQAPLRASHCIPMPGEPDASLLVMPAWRSGQRIGVKLVTVFPGNADRGKRSVAAVYMLFDGSDGTPVALLDGEELTARRTAGASAYASSKLARRNAHHLVMVGAGRMARPLIEAHRHARPLERVSIWSRTEDHARATAAACVRDGIPARAVADLAAAVSEADVVSCATLARSPVVRGEWLRPGVHVDLVGAFTKDMRESDDVVMQRADVIVVDDRAAALVEGGDVVQAITGGAIGSDKIAADLRDLARGAHPGRTHDDQITVFKSVGFALEDLAAAEAVFAAAQAEEKRP
jgi:alanine dehydrogenase